MEKGGQMKWGSLAINIKLQHYPHFGAVMHVLQRHRAGSPTSGSCCYSASSFSVSENGESLLKEISNLLLLAGNESTGDKRKGIPAAFPGHAFLPLICVWAMRPPLAGVRPIYLHQWPQGLCQGSWGHSRYSHVG